MLIQCDVHSGAIVVMDYVGACPLCEAETKLKDLEYAYAELEKDFDAIEKELSGFETRIDELETEINAFREMVKE